MPTTKTVEPQAEPESSLSITQTTSSASMPRSSAMEMVDVDGPTQTISSIDIRPQAMAPITEVESSGGMSTQTLLALFWVVPCFCLLNF